MGSRRDSGTEDIAKVAILTQFYPPDYAATGQLIEELAFQLGDLGLPVQIFTGQPGYAFKDQSAPALERLDRVLVRRSRTASMWPQRIRGKAMNGVLFTVRSGLHLLKLAFKRATNASDRNEILLLTTAPPFLPILGFIANLLLGLPYVCLLYDLYPDAAVELKVLPAKHIIVRLWEFLNRCAWRKATRIIVLSPTMKERVTAKCPDVADKIAVIHNWADPNRIVPVAKQKNWFAEKFNLVDKFTILYSGNMGRCHDMDTILEAAAILKDEPKIQFIFIGSGAKREAFIEQANKLGLNNCRFLPYQDKQNLPYSLTACDLSLVSVSPGMEGIVVPSKMYAALAAGRPIAAICEPNSYLCQMIGEAKCGVTFRNGDADGLAQFICNLASNSQTVEQMGRAGRRYLQSNFTPEIIAKQYSKVLSQAALEAMAPTNSIHVNKQVKPKSI